MTKTVRSLLFVVVARSLLLAACGAPATEAPVVAESTVASATEAPVVVEATVAVVEDPMAIYAPDAVEGDIITTGSSTVFPLSELMAKLFQQEGYTDIITVDSIGTGAGFERLLRRWRIRYLQCLPRHQG